MWKCAEKISLSVRMTLLQNTARDVFRVRLFVVQIHLFLLSKVKTKNGERGMNVSLKLDFDVVCMSCKEMSEVNLED